MIEIKLNAAESDVRIGIVQARFNEDITADLLAGAERALKEANIEGNDVVLVKVAGALEIAHALDVMADTGEFDALVALGAVIKGDTYHFEVVCNESAAGITRVGIDHCIPIGNGVLTTFTEEQAKSRAEQKGYEAVQAALELVDLRTAITDALDE